MFGVSSKSRSSSDSSSQTLTAGDNSLLSTVKTGKKSTVLGAGATLNKFGKNADVTINQTDGGALALAQDAIANAQKAIESTVKTQADNTAAALGSLGKLGETRVTGGENLAEQSNRTLYVVLGVAVVAIVAFLWKR